MIVLSNKKGMAQIEDKIEDMITYDGGKLHFTDEFADGPVVSVQYFECGGYAGRPVDKFVEVCYGSRRAEHRYELGDAHGFDRANMAQLIADVAFDVWHWILGEEIAEGDVIDKVINQGVRECEVIKINRTRCRLAYEMPNAGDYGGWYPIVKLFGKTVLKRDYRG